MMVTVIVLLSSNWRFYTLCLCLWVRGHGCSNWGTSEKIIMVYSNILSCIMWVIAEFINYVIASLQWYTEMHCMGYYGIVCCGVLRRPGLQWYTEMHCVMYHYSRYQCGNGKAAANRQWTAHYTNWRFVWCCQKGCWQHTIDQMWFSTCDFYLKLTYISITTSTVSQLRLQTFRRLIPR